MNGRIAKILRKQSYGKDGSPRFRRYEGRVTEIVIFQEKDHNGEVLKETKEDRITLSAGPTRRLYQHAKKRYKAMKELEGIWKKHRILDLDHIAKCMSKTAPVA